MSFRGFDHLHGSDLSALLAAQNNSTNNVSVASMLLGQHNPNVMPSLMSLASFNNNGNLHQQAQAGQPQPPQAAPVQAQNNQYQSQTAQLLTALLEQQQREDQKKAVWIQQLNNALYGSQQAPPPPSPADNLALFLQQKQLALSNQSSANSLAMLAGVPMLGGVSPSASIYGGPCRVGPQVDSVALAKLLQSQNQRQQQACVTDAPLSGPTDPTDAAALVAHLNSVSARSALMSSDAALAAGRTRKGRTGTFPQKLHQMLSDLERLEGGTDIASFLPHGRAFAIHKPRDFVKEVMSKYFRMSRFSSFQRQLNLYDFQRITEGPDKGSYYHELFVQGRPILSTMMKRNKIKGVKNLKQDREEKLDEQNDEKDDGDREDEEDEMDDEEDE